MIDILPVELINNFTKRFHYLSMPCHVSGQDEVYDPLSYLFPRLRIHVGKNIRPRLGEIQYENDLSSYNMRYRIFRSF